MKKNIKKSLMGVSARVEIDEMPPRVKQFMAELRAWADQKRGRRVELAKFLGLPRQTITDWLGERQNPTAEQLLAIQEYLRNRR
jgi:DNA-binding XRE family transcriptional regulator